LLVKVDLGEFRLGDTIDASSCSAWKLKVGLVLKLIIPPFKITVNL